MPFPFECSLQVVVRTAWLRRGKSPDGRRNADAYGIGSGRDRIEAEGTIAGWGSNPDEVRVVGSILAKTQSAEQKL